MSLRFADFFTLNYTSPKPVSFDICVKADILVPEFLNERRITRLTCIRSDGDINMPLFQQLINISNSVIICNYDGYELPQFIPGQEVAFDVHDEKYINYHCELPQHDNYWIIFRDTWEFHHELLYVSRIKNINAFHIADYSILPSGATTIKTTVNNESFSSLVLYCENSPKTQLKLYVPSCSVELINLGLIADQIEELTMIMKGGFCQHFARQCIAIDRPITISFRLIDVKLDEINEFIELVRGVDIKPLNMGFNIVKPGYVQHFIQGLNRNSDNFRYRKTKALFN